VLCFYSVCEVILARFVQIKAIKINFYYRDFLNVRLFLVCRFGGEREREKHGHLVMLSMH
jgi:hypothetical protein